MIRRFKHTRGFMPFKGKDISFIEFDTELNKACIVFEDGERFEKGYTLLEALDNTFRGFWVELPVQDAKQKEIDNLKKHIVELQESIRWRDERISRLEGQIYDAKSHLSAVRNILKDD